MNKLKIPFKSTFCRINFQFIFCRVKMTNGQKCTFFGLHFVQIHPFSDHPIEKNRRRHRETPTKVAQSWRRNKYLRFPKAKSICI
jgi:hypothetical protein